MEKLFIWGDKIPYNSDRSKKEDMSLKERPKLITTLAGFKAIFSAKPAAPCDIDGITWLRDIQEGEDSETYTDAPSLIPYIVKGSRYTVVLVPGGGFCFKTMKEEGHEVAQFLNGKGISAFVLDYRVNPYRFPAAVLDLKRAVQFLRANEESLGLTGTLIGAMGFSAGAYVAGQYLLNHELQITDPAYTPDSVDQADSHADFGALLYPAVNFNRLINALYALEGPDVYDPVKGEQLKKKHDLIPLITEASPRQFICYGSKEVLTGASEYYDRLQELGVDSYRLILNGASHGFGSCSAKNNRKYAYWMEEFAAWLTR